MSILLRPGPACTVSSMADAWAPDQAWDGCYAGKINAAYTAPFEIPGEVSNLLQSAAVKPIFDAIGIRWDGA